MIHFKNTRLPFLGMRTLYTNPQLSIIPMFHGTSRQTAWHIVNGGFSTVVAQDEGFFGKGIYFSSDVDYAKHYAKYYAEVASKL